MAMLDKNMGWVPHTSDVSFVCEATNCQTPDFGPVVVIWGFDDVDGNVYAGRGTGIAALCAACNTPENRAKA